MNNNTLGVYIDRRGMLRCRKTVNTDKPPKLTQVILQKECIFMLGPLTRPSIIDKNGSIKWRTP